MAKKRRKTAARGTGSRNAAQAALRAGTDLGALGLAGRKEKGDLIEMEETIDAGVRRARIRTQSVLDRYLARAQITRRQFDAAERLHGTWRASGSAQTVVASYGLRVGGGGDLTQRQAALRSDVTSALLAVGNRLASVLVHVCLCDEPAGTWGERQRGKAADGIPVLRLALDSLADHWGLPQEPL